MTLGLVIVELLAADGRSMRQMARESGIDVGYLSRLLSGQKPFHPKALNAALDCLAVSRKRRRRLNRLAAREAGWDI